MSRFDRPVYAPPPVRTGRAAHLALEEPPRRPPILLGLGVVISGAFAAIVWNVYGGFDSQPIRIEAPEAYKSAPSAAELESQTALAESLYQSLEGREEQGDVRLRPADEAPLPEPEAIAAAAAEARAVDSAPVFLADGPYLAQVAALRTEEGAAPLWRRLSERAPDLFADAQLNVQRVELGQQGVYWRVRAGAFADRANADLFCARVRALGQECIAVRR